MDEDLVKYLGDKGLMDDTLSALCMAHVKTWNDLRKVTSEMVDKLPLSEEVAEVQKATLKSVLHEMKAPRKSEMPEYLLSNAIHYAEICCSIDEFSPYCLVKCNYGGHFQHLQDCLEEIVFQDSMHLPASKSPKWPYLICILNCIVDSSELELNSTYPWITAVKEFLRRYRELRDVAAPNKLSSQSVGRSAATIASKLEKEMQVSTEIQCQLQRATEERREILNYRELIVHAVARVEQRQEEAAANTEDTELRLQSGAGDGHMDRLPDDVKTTLLKIQRLVGGLGRQFGEALLHRHLSWSPQEIQDGGMFFSCSKFWQCIWKWEKASSEPNTDAPLTLQHLLKACSSLTKDPISLSEMAKEKKDVLEENFDFLSDNVLVIHVITCLRDSGRLTEEALTFLLMPGTSRQKMDRLLAVVYSLGEEGFDLLMDALKKSGHPHVVDKLTTDLTKNAQNTRGDPVDTLGEKSPPAEGEDKDTSEDEDAFEADVEDMDSSEVRRNFNNLPRRVELLHESVLIILATIVFFEILRSLGPS